MLMLQPKFLGFSESTQYPALTIFLFLLSTCNRIYIFKQCVQVPENIQTPTTEGIGNSREVGGGGGQKPRKFQRGGAWNNKITFLVNIISFAN